MELLNPRIKLKDIDKLSGDNMPQEMIYHFGANL